MSLRVLPSALAAALALTTFCAAPPLLAQTAPAAAPAAAAQPLAGWYGALVDTAFVRAQVDIPPKKGVLLIDLRPAARRYDVGHIPGSINIPDSEFDKLTGQLPADKATPLIFYCGGLDCVLSDKSAIKARALGYTEIRTFPEGYPAWTASQGQAEAAAPATAPPPTPAPTPAVALVAGKEKGSVTVDSFQQVWKAQPASVMLIDVRDAKEFANGAITGAVNLPINELERQIATLPLDKPVVFICGTGARSGEAYDMVKLYRAEVQAFFIDAEAKFMADGSYTMTKR